MGARAGLANASESVTGPGPGAARPKAGLAGPAIVETSVKAPKKGSAGLGPRGLSAFSKYFTPNGKEQALHQGAPRDILSARSGCQDWP